MQLPRLPLVVLDTETTGFVPRVHRIIEFAMVRVEDGSVADEYETLLSIPDEIPPHVQVITRIRPGDLQDKPTFADMHDEILKKMQGDVLFVGQNLGFDLGMLKGEDMDLTDKPWIDTSMLASLVFPEHESYSLGYLSTVLNLTHEPKHRALGDVRATLELLEACWTRLLELPTDHLLQAKEVLKKSSEGYALLADALPDTGKDNAPTWLTVEHHAPTQIDAPALEISLPHVGTVDVREEPLDADHLSRVIAGCAANTDVTHWIAVKNLHEVIRRIALPEAVRVLHPASSLLDTTAAEQLRSQQTYTSDEASLLLKLDWYDVHTRNDAAFHGGEKDVWYGKVACTPQSTAYTTQFQDLPSVMLLDHKQLLEILGDSAHPAQKSFTVGTHHIIIDDASMLEDTATKAYGNMCSLDILRASTEGHKELSSFCNLLQLWTEKVRMHQDQYYVRSDDLLLPETKGLRDQLDALLKEKDLSQQTRMLLEGIRVFLDPGLLPERIVWIEVAQNGTQYLHTVPLSIALLLKEHLYKRFPTTLLVPQASASVPEILLDSQEVAHNEANTQDAGMSLTFALDSSIQALLRDPPSGKSILLLGSRRGIEQVYIEHMEALEQQGITLICQGMSGGQGRMTAEFLAAEGDAIWVMTPWNYEGVELPAHTVNLLALETLPFDHPNHAVGKKRGERYRSSFAEYSMPRLMNRLFRLLRTYRRHCTQEREVLIFDQRIDTKSYGADVKAYLEELARPSGPQKPKGPVQPTLL